MEINKIYCESCLDTIQHMLEENIKCNIVLTSPPYNTSRHNSFDKYLHRYKMYDDVISNDDYIKRTVNLFNKLDGVLEKNGVILYNMSYASNNTSTYLLTIAEVIKNTNFDLVDTIVWKKNTCLRDNRSSNRLSRIVEFIFVMVRKDEKKSFITNKERIGTAKSGAGNYKPIENFIVAPNNDGSNDLNKAIYSTKLCDKLLNIYAKEGMLVYDPFIGIGTTAFAAIKHNCKFIGSEIDSKQVYFANKKIEML